MNEPTPLEQKLAQCESVIRSRDEKDPVRIRRERERQQLIDAIAAERPAIPAATPQ